MKSFLLVLTCQMMSSHTSSIRFYPSNQVNNSLLSIWNYAMNVSTLNRLLMMKLVQFFQNGRPKGLNRLSLAMAGNF
jgi:hypothetical protein